jgi:hypothetical protein
VSPDAHPSSYSSVATTLYPTLVCLFYESENKQRLFPYTELTDSFF